MYNHNMSAKKKSWFGIAKTFVKAVEKANAQSQSAARSRAPRPSAPAPIVEPSITVTFTNDDGKQYINGMQRMAHSDKYETLLKNHLAFLADFYRQQAPKYEIKNNDNQVVKLIHDDYPTADAHTCPYCGVIHDFSASRARKCPDCGSQMIVRQGVFLSEEQVAKLDKEITDFYDKTGQISQVKSSVEQVQTYLSEGNYGRAFLAAAQGYEACAIIYNKSYEGGYRAWDYAWNALAEASETTAVGAKSQVDLITNGYTDVALARGMHCLRELKYSQTATAVNKYAKIAMLQFYEYLIALGSLGLTDWNQESAIKNIYVAELLGRVSKEDVEEIRTRALDHTSIKPSKELFTSIMHQIDEYVFLETDPERLRQYIY